MTTSPTVALEERTSESELRRELKRAVQLLDAAQTIVLRLPQCGPDDLLVWEWIRDQLERRTANPAVGTVRTVGSTSMVLGRSAWVGRDRRVLDLELPSPTSSDLLQVLYSRRCQLVVHYGLFIPRRTQRRAFELSSLSQAPNHGRLGPVFDLLDESVLAYRQSLLRLASGAKDAARIEKAFALLGLGIERAVRPRQGAPDQVLSKASLRRAVRDFEHLIVSLEGCSGASVVAPAFVESFVAFRS